MPSKACKFPHCVQDRKQSIAYRYLPFSIHSRHISFVGMLEICQTLYLHLLPQGFVQMSVSQWKPSWPSIWKKEKKTLQHLSPFYPAFWWVSFHTYFAYHHVIKSVCVQHEAWLSPSCVVSPSNCVWHVASAQEGLTGRAICQWKLTEEEVHWLFSTKEKKDKFVHPFPSKKMKN